MGLMPDTPNFRDAPVFSHPREITVQSVEVMLRHVENDPSVQALLLVRSEQVTVYDFYRGRPG